MSIDKLPPAPDPQPDDPLFGEVGMTAPDTVHVGFENAPPRPDERAAFDQGRAAVRDTHPSIRAGFSREDGNGHESYATQTKKKLSVGAIKAAIAGIVALGGGIGGMMAVNGSHHDTDTTPPDGVKPPVASAPAVAGQKIEQQPQISTYQREINPADCYPLSAAPNSQEASVPVSLGECGMFDSLTPEQQQQILKYEQMPLTEFQRLPYDEQLTFAAYIIENRAPVGQAAMNTYRKANGLDRFGLVANYQHTQDSSTIDKGSIEQFDAAFQAVVSATTVRNETTGQLTVDTVTARKAAVAVAVPGSRFGNELDKILANSTTGVFDVNTGAGQHERSLLFTDDIYGGPTGAGSTKVNGAEVPLTKVELMQTVGDMNSPIGMMGSLEVGLGNHDVTFGSTTYTTFDGKKSTAWALADIGPTK